MENVPISLDGLDSRRPGARSVRAMESNARHDALGKRVDDHVELPAVAARFRSAYGALFLATALLIFLAFGCSASSPSPLETFARNLTAAQCDNQQATLANLPLTFVTPAQAATILAGACAALFGTSPAPTPAPGNGPVFAGPTPAPSSTIQLPTIAPPAQVK